MVVVLAIERAIFYNWKHFWLETDSTLVLHAFSHPKSVHWSIYNRWMNCINHINHINFRISHIYREGNVCVAKLASFGAQSSGYTWWDSPPSFVVQQFLKYRQELPFYRFSQSNSFGYGLALPNYFVYLSSLIYLDGVFLVRQGLECQHSWDVNLYFSFAPLDPPLLLKIKKDCPARHWKRNDNVSLMPLMTVQLLGSLFN